MSYIKVDGYELPPPKRGVHPIVTTVVDAGRNANGAVVAQKVGRDQYKIDGLEWAWLTAAQWKAILSKLNKFVVDVEFIDPVTNRPIVIKMYCGDRTGEPYWVDGNGNPTHYKDCKVNLIDMGRSITRK